jgi:hypothetical protein
LPWPQAWRSCVTSCALEWVAGRVMSPLRQPDQ